MSTNLKLLVIAFLQNQPSEPHDCFNQAFDFYVKSENKNKHSELHYNRLGYSEQLLKNLLYDLQRAYEISDVEILTPIAVEEVVDETPVIPLIPVDDTPENELLNDERTLDIETLDTEVVGVESKTNQVEESVSIRSEFPFLNDKACPVIFFTIVGLRINKHKQYQELHQQLQDINSEELALTDEQKLQLVKDCEAAFNENQMLWDELNHYNLNKQILGKHPIFREGNIQKEVELMTNEDMFKFKASSTKFFHDQKKALVTNAEKPAKIELINQKIADREYKLSLINAKLGINTDDKK